MSGVEVAGLVLGAIPLILASVEFYAKGIAVSRRCSKYREQFQSLVVELGTEKTICVNSLHRILVGIVKPKDMAEFLADPGGSRWKGGSFNDKLQKRLGTSYDSYIATVDELRKTIDTFKKRLKLDSSGKPLFTDEENFRKYYKRLGFSLKKSDYDDLIGSLRRANYSLDCMTTQTISLETLQSTHKIKKPPMPRFQTINEHAQGFHAVIESGWQCSCHANHSVHLRLEHRIDDFQNEESDEDEALQGPFHVVFHNDHFASTVDSSSSTARTPWSWGEADVQITIEQRSSTGPAASVSGSKGVRFSKEAKKAVQAALGPTRDMQPIQSLCAAISTLQTPQRDMCLSLLANEYTKRKHGILIYPSRSPPLESEDWTVRNLRSVLADTKFSRRHRVQLAVTLASSVLQLYETPWLENSWTDSDILFIDKSGQTAYTEPFVLQRPETQAQVQGDTTLPPIMRHVIRNQALYTLGICLIELWFKKPLSEMHEAPDGLLSTGDTLTELTTELATAYRLVDCELRDDAGGSYADAVRRCISCDFDCRFKTLDDASFQKAVFEGVVTPVKETFDYMFRAAI